MNCKMFVSFFLFLLVCQKMNCFEVVVVPMSGTFVDFSQVPKKKIEEKRLNVNKTDEWTLTQTPTLQFLNINDGN